jgi:23S rRNA pseudouridine1911/1915/1917 synthase
MSEQEFSRGERLDQYVARQLPGLSRASSSKLIDKGRVSVNGTVQTKAGYKLREDDKIGIDYNESTQPSIPKIDIEVLYEDDDCVVVNKPIGLLSHSKGAFNPEATVASWVLSRVSDMAGDRAGIVHRLDRSTSGVMIMAKNPDALHWLQKQFSLRKVKKTYTAIVEGVLNEPEAVIDMPIERNPKKPQTFRVGSNGKPAVTAYKVLKTDGKRSLVEMKPTTGRTHQLRVHLEHLGHPIVGDAFYGAKDADRLFLHAQSLEITLPNRERKIFEVPVPKEFEELVA